MLRQKDEAGGRAPRARLGYDGPGARPAEAVLVHEQPHELGDRERRVRVVELEGDLVWERVPVVVAMHLPEAPHDVLRAPQ